MFSYSGLSVKEKNFLEVLSIEKWANKSVPKLKEGDILKDFDLEV